MKKTALFLSAVSIVAGVSYGLARGGHGGGSDQEHFDRNTNQTWCDVNPSCNGYDALITQVRAYNAARAVQARVNPPQPQAYAFAPNPVILIARKPEKKPVRVVQHAPLNLVPDHLRIAYAAIEGR